MGLVRVTYALGAGVALACVLAACGGQSGGASPADGASGLAVELTYADAATLRAEGLARALAASDTPPAPSIARPPQDSWLRLTVTAHDFAPIVCEFPRREGGRCDGIPAGTGRVVAVEEWDATFENLYFRGQRAGVTVHRGRDTPVRVTMRSPVTIIHPAADGAVNRRTFDAEVQTEPGALVHLFLGPWQVGSATANATGVATLPVDRTRTGLDPLPGDPAGLADGEYLLTAVSHPPPGRAPAVRHLGAPHSFTIDLVPPALQLSAPSVTPDLSVDVAGITEPGAVVRCGAGTPGDDLRPPVVGGRFALVDFPVGPASVQVACDATDRAGNRTLATLAVAHRPDSFALHVTVPDVTNQPGVPLAVQTASNVDAVRVEVASADGAASLAAVAAAALGGGSFAADVPLLRNQWNRLRVVALVGTVEVGETSIAVEQDDVMPATPLVAWRNVPLAAGWLRSGTLVLPHISFGFVPAEPVLRIEIAAWDDDSGWTWVAEGAETTIFAAEPPDAHLGFASPETQVFSVPSGVCFTHLLARAGDRAGNSSRGWRPIWLNFVAGFTRTCVE